MPQGTKKTRHVAELDPAKLYAHSYALRLAKQVAQEIERPRRSTTRKKKLRRNSA
jgi:hypothetical protein